MLWVETGLIGKRVIQDTESERGVLRSSREVRLTRTCWERGRSSRPWAERWSRRRTEPAGSAPGRLRQARGDIHTLTIHTATQACNEDEVQITEANHKHLPWHQRVLDTDVPAQNECLKVRSKSSQRDTSEWRSARILYEGFCSSSSFRAHELTVLLYLSLDFTELVFPLELLHSEMHYSSQKSDICKVIKRSVSIRSTNLPWREYFL